MKKLVCVFLLTLAAAIFLFPNMAPAEKPEVINVAVIGDFSGPYAPVVGATRPGAEDAWEHINNVLGGVKGVKVNPIIGDMSGKVDIGLAKYNEVINVKPKPKFVDIYITPLSEALKPRYVEDGVVGFHAGAIVSLYPQANSYGLYALYPEMMALLVKWMKDNWKEKRNPRLGILTWDTSYGRAILTDEFFAYLKKIGVDLAGKPQLFGIRDVDTTTQLMALRSEKADFIATNTGAGGTLAMKKGLKEMNWEVQLLNTFGEDWGTIRMDPAAFQGDIIFLPTKSYDETDDPSIKTLMGYFNKNNRTIKDKTIFYMVAWYTALLEHKVMTEVVEKHGWEGLTAANLKEALNKTNNFLPLDGITRLTYSDKRRTPSVGRLYRIEGEKMLPLTEFQELEDMRPPEFR